MSQVSEMLEGLGVEVPQDVEDQLLLLEKALRERGWRRGPEGMHRIGEKIGSICPRCGKNPYLARQGICEACRLRMLTEAYEREAEIIEAARGYDAARQRRHRRGKLAPLFNVGSTQSSLFAS